MVVIDGVDKLRAEGTKVKSRARGGAAADGLMNPSTAPHILRPDRNFLVDGGAVARRRARLASNAPVSALCLKKVDYPTDSGDGFFSRREPRMS